MALLKAHKKSHPQLAVHVQMYKYDTHCSSQYSALTYVWTCPHKNHFSILGTAHSSHCMIDSHFQHSARGWSQPWTWSQVWCTCYSCHAHGEAFQRNSCQWPWGTSTPQPTGRGYPWAGGRGEGRREVEGERERNKAKRKDKVIPTYTTATLYTTSKLLELL